MDVIKDYLVIKNKLSSIYSTLEDKWAHLCTRRGNLEKNLRVVVKKIILMSAKLDQNVAKEYVMSKVFNDKDSRRKYSSYSYSDLFDPSKSLIFFKHLTNLVTGKWNEFKLVMGKLTQEEFINLMNVLNNEGRFDAHAKNVTNEDIVLFDAAIVKLETICNNYHEMVE